ncbi:MAG TPA: VCBS repeat-containing protein [Gemmataceae bacterium]|nr:VCBS repeat-containing protein [Gemmataceae bacterium]
MSRQLGWQQLRGWWLVSLALIALGTTATATTIYLSRPTSIEATAKSADAVASASPPRTYRSSFQIQYFCTRCHAYPPADSFPRFAWKQEVEQAYQFFAQSGLAMQAPPFEQVLGYYQDNAPVELPLPAIVRATNPMPLQFRRTDVAPPVEVTAPAVANVSLVHLFDERRLDVLACDMRAGLVMALSPYAQAPAWKVLGRVPNPAHAEVIDLDGDGVKDILVANLGSMEPTDRRTGSVVWLRGSPDGRFTPVTILDGIGRVADVQAADFRGVGKLDLVVAAFGWRKTGEVIYLENRTTDWSHPVFVPHVLDDRHGAIHVPVGDINGDGRPDFVALISQEHETIVAFLNEGGGHFRKETIYAGPHPAYGSTGIQLADLNGDGKLDVLYTNGDSMDEPHVLKPYHGIQWLENQGRYPFVHHPITPMPGVHRAVAADFRGTGKLDIVAVSFLPSSHFPQRAQLGLDAVIYLQQIAPGQFARHSLETSTCDHVSCFAGDIFGSGKIDLVTGNLVSGPANSALTIWKNSGEGR